MSFAESLCRGIAGTKSIAQKERERINFIKELLAIYDRKKIKEKDMHDCAKNIAAEFFVDEIVASRNGDEITINSEKRVSPPVDQQKEMFNAIREKYPEADMLTVKNNGKYDILYFEKDTLYSLKAAGDISSLEVKKIVEKVNDGRVKWQESSQ